MVRDRQVEVRDKAASSRTVHRRWMLMLLPDPEAWGSNEGDADNVDGKLAATVLTIARRGPGSKAAVLPFLSVDMGLVDMCEGSHG